MRIVIFCLCVFFHLCASSQSFSVLQKNRVQLPNGWHLTPVGKQLPLGDLPLNLAVSPDKKYMAVTNNGESTQSIQLFDVQKEKELHSVEIAKGWYGLAFSRDGRYLYASGGNDNWILQYRIYQSRLWLQDSIPLGPKWPHKISPAGLALDDRNKKLYAVTKENNRLYIIDLAGKKVTDSFPLPAEAYTTVYDPAHKKLYISCWGCDQVVPFDVLTKTFLPSIPVGDNPNEMVLSKNGRLFVCNANDNSVSVIDTRTGRVTETLNAALYPNAPSGSTTNGICLSEEEKSLYIANADNNCLAVYDVSVKGQSKAKGFIPVGWFPTGVKMVQRKLWVLNAKGLTSLPNPKGPNPTRPEQKGEHHKDDWKKQEEVQYIGGLFKGSLSIIPPVNPWQLAEYTKAVYANTPYSKSKESMAEGEKNSPIPSSKQQKSPIKYVFYIIKENRTYDQVLGDVPEGNGDSSLVLFGERITPNQHALAKQFVLLDNFYVNAEVSADGHNWSLGGYATDYLEKNWPTYYGGRGGSYDAEGTRAIANNKGGFLWDHCKRQGISYRTYGEFADDYKANIPSLENHFCPYFTSWNTSVRDTTRFYQWKRDFDSLMRIGKVPRLNTLRFINDHTDGLSLGRPSPFAHVADNDLAVGLFVEYLSHSPIWKETAIFILEDDAQNGADHVDAHRSTAYLAGGFVKRGFVDHTLYTTASMLRTMELILGIPPMTQYDAAATPMWRCFTAKVDTTPFKALPPNVDFEEKNMVLNEWQRRSQRFDLTREDANSDIEFNTVLWHAIKGEVPFPGPRRAAFVQVRPETDDDD